MVILLLQRDVTALPWHISALLLKYLICLNNNYVYTTTPITVGARSKARRKLNPAQTQPTPSPRMGDSVRHSL
jgi:hypothetical protein